jgi:hypothetical protein
MREQPTPAPPAPRPDPNAEPGQIVTTVSTDGHTTKITTPKP